MDKQIEKDIKTKVKPLNENKHRDVYLNEVVDPETQAKRIIDKFGGARALSRALTAVGAHRDPATVFRWLYPKSKGGTNGIIPTAAWPDIMAAARHDGIVISVDDLDPRLQYKNTRNVLYTLPETDKTKARTIVRRKLVSIPIAPPESEPTETEKPDSDIFS